MAIQLGISVQGVEDVMRGFAALAPGLQKKYLRAAVNKVTKPHTKAVKALVNRGPTGNLKRSVGVKTEAKVKGKTQTAVLGFRRGKAKTELGFHAWWIEHGVKVRRSKSGKMMKVPGTQGGKYPYLKGNLSKAGEGDKGFAFFREVQGFAGTGNFEAWASSSLPGIRDALQTELVSALAKATAEAARRAQRAAEGKK